MIWFEYKYTWTTEIFNNINIINEYSIFEYSLLAGLILLLILNIYYIIPSISLYLKFRDKEKSKDIRKQIIKQIAMQKDINDVIEKELNI